MNTLLEHLASDNEKAHNVLSSISDETTEKVFAGKVQDLKNYLFLNAGFSPQKLTI